MTYDLEHLGRQVDKLSDAIEENTKRERRKQYERHRGTARPYAG